LTQTYEKSFKSTKSSKYKIMKALTIPILFLAGVLGVISAILAFIPRKKSVLIIYPPNSHPYGDNFNQFKESMESDKSLRFEILPCSSCWLLLALLPRTTSVHVIYYLPKFGRSRIFSESGDGLLLYMLKFRRWFSCFGISSKLCVYWSKNEWPEQSNPSDHLLSGFPVIRDLDLYESGSIPFEQ